jgi:hypothetical protein
MSYFGLVGSEAGILPIQRKFMSANQLFALEFREGFLFGRTIRRRITQYKPWPLIDSNGTIIDIPALTTQAELRFRDPRNTMNDILYLDKTTQAGLPWFYHGAFGVKPQYINMYLRYPEGDTIPGKFPAIDPIRPQAGDNISQLNSLSSPFEEPTDYHECVLQPLNHISAEYYNRDDTRSHEPVINIMFCLYFVQLFKPVTHPLLISNIAARRYEGQFAKFLTVGFGDFPENIYPQTEKDWGVTPLTLDQALALGGGR